MEKITKYFLPLLVTAMTVFTTESYGQRNVCCSTAESNSQDGGNWRIGRPHGCVRPGRQIPVRVSFDDSSTLLTVNFPSNTEGGTVEVFCNGSKVAGITAGGGTTFSCILKDYGAGDYDIIVSSGNTVVYSRNITVR
jgi:hypothetical protein